MVHIYDSYNRDVGLVGPGGKEALCPRASEGAHTAEPSHGWPVPVMSGDYSGEGGAQEV